MDWKKICMKRDLDQVCIDMIPVKMNQEDMITRDMGRFQYVQDTRKQIYDIYIYNMHNIYLLILIILVLF